MRGKREACAFMLGRTAANEMLGLRGWRHWDDKYGDGGGEDARRGIDEVRFGRETWYEVAALGWGRFRDGGKVGGLWPLGRAQCEEKE
jgi:hypothetical protein